MSGFAHIIIHYLSPKVNLIVRINVFMAYIGGEKC